MTRDTTSFNHLTTLSRHKPSQFALFALYAHAWSERTGREEGQRKQKCNRSANAGEVSLGEGALVTTQPKEITTTGVEFMLSTAVLSTYLVAPGLTTVLSFCLRNVNASHMDTSRRTNLSGNLRGKGICFFALSHHVRILNLSVKFGIVGRVFFFSFSFHPLPHLLPSSSARHPNPTTSI